MVIKELFITATNLTEILNYLRQVIPDIYALKEKRLDLLVADTTCQKTISNNGMAELKSLWAS